MAHDVETWRDWLGVYHASVPWTDNGDVDMSRARDAINAAREWEDLPPTDVVFERIAHHEHAVYRQTALCD